MYAYMMHKNITNDKTFIWNIAIYICKLKDLGPADEHKILKMNATK